LRSTEQRVTRGKERLVESGRASFVSAGAAE